MFPDNETSAKTKTTYRKNEAKIIFFKIFMNTPFINLKKTIIQA